MFCRLPKCDARINPEAKINLVAFDDLIEKTASCDFQSTQRQGSRRHERLQGCALR